jgi:predicted nicotinamide N-methyase
MSDLPVPLDDTLVETVETVGRHAYRLVGLQSFEAAVDRLYGRIKGRATQRELEDLSPMFGVIWGAARALAGRLDAAGTALAGDSLVELGCGLALPSMVAARHGARALATDQHVGTEALLRRNLEANGLSLAYRRFDWRGAAPADLAGRFDRVVASDVLYDRELAPALAAAVEALLAPGGVAWVADPGRPWLDAFVTESERRGLRASVDVDRVERPGGPEDAFVVVLRR